MLLFLLLTGTTLNVMSLMGVVMMVGIVVSNSILIVEFAGILHKRREIACKQAVATASRQRLRPMLMTSLATLLGLIPMALGDGSRERSVRAAGPRDHRRIAGVRGRDGISGAGRVFADARKKKQQRCRREARIDGAAACVRGGDDCRNGAAQENSAKRNDAPRKRKLRTANR